MSASVKYCTRINRANKIVLFDRRKLQKVLLQLDGDFSKLYLRELQQIPSLHDLLRLQIGLDPPQEAAYRV